MMHFTTIVIEFAVPAWVSSRETNRDIPLGRLIRLAESKTESEHTFTLYDGTQPGYTLTADESGQLLRLLGQIVVKAPWDAKAGFDGTTYTLMLKGPMSEMRFNWWVQVPKGWESIKAVFDYVMALTERKGHSR